MVKLLLHGTAKFFKSFASHSPAFKPTDATVVVLFTSPYRVLSKRTCSSFGKSSFSFFHLKGSSSFALFNVKHYSNISNTEFHSSKRRSRGPVMAAKKAAEGAKQEDGKYKHTVDLPKTTSGKRANSIVREPELQKYGMTIRFSRELLTKIQGFFEIIKSIVFLVGIVMAYQLS